MIELSMEERNALAEVRAKLMQIEGLQVKVDCLLDPIFKKLATQVIDGPRTSAREEEKLLDYLPDSMYRTELRTLIYQKYGR